MNVRFLVLMGLAFIVSAVLIPYVFNTIAGTTHSGWNAAVWTIFSIVLPIVGAIALAIKFIPGAGGKSAQTRLKDYAGRFFRNQAAAASIKDAIFIAIGLFFTAYLFPIGMSELSAASFNSTTVGSAVYTISTIVFPILFLAGVIIHFLSGGGKK